MKTLKKLVCAVIGHWYPAIRLETRCEGITIGDCVYVTEKIPQPGERCSRCGEVPY